MDWMSIRFFLLSNSSSLEKPRAEKAKFRVCSSSISPWLSGFFEIFHGDDAVLQAGKNGQAQAGLALVLDELQVEQEIQVVRLAQVELAAAVG